MTRQTWSKQAPSLAASSPSYSSYLPLSWPRAFWQPPSPSLAVLFLFIVPPALISGAAPFLSFSCRLFVGTQAP